MAPATRAVGEIGVDVDEERARQVRLVVLVATLVMIGEVVPAVAHDGRCRQLGLGEPRDEFVDGDE
jgi:hypothetical protein